MVCFKPSPKRVPSTPPYLPKVQKRPAHQATAKWIQQAKGQHFVSQASHKASPNALCSIIAMWLCVKLSERGCAERALTTKTHREPMGRQGIGATKSLFVG